MDCSAFVLLHISVVSIDECATGSRNSAIRFTVDWCEAIALNFVCKHTEFFVVLASIIGPEVCMFRIQIQLILTKLINHKYITLLSDINYIFPYVMLSMNYVKLCFK
jgi:hypothetical protein